MASIYSDYITQFKSLLNDQNNRREIKLIKHNDNLSNIILNIELDTYPLKIITDFNKYCFAESVFNVNEFNKVMCFTTKSPDQIILEMCRTINIEVKKNISNPSLFSDPFHIYQKIDECVKYSIDYKNLEDTLNKIMEKNKQSETLVKIPKELLLLPNQITQLIINEIKKVNRNHSYKHYIVPDISNPFELYLRFNWDSDSIIDKIFQEIKKNFNYDYMEIKLTINPKTYPFTPPKLEYIKPKIKFPLLLSLINLDILKIENWSSTITLEYFMINLGEQIKPYIIDNIINETKIDGINDALEYEIIKLASQINNISDNKININIPLPKKIDKNDTSKNDYWKAGTGYGREGIKEWDIKAYIKQQEIQLCEITSILKNINKLITKNNIKIVINSILINYLIDEIKGFTLLEYNKSTILFDQIFSILENLIDKSLDENIIIIISKEIKHIHEELELLINSCSSTISEKILQIYCLSDWFVSKYKKNKVTSITSYDIQTSYCEIMKKLQFGNYDIPHSHRFRKYLQEKPTQNALMRILSEIGSFKKNLPLNWETSIWVRIPKNNFNIFSFLICGPKDTPYENGLFEFHGYFPSDYPNTVPQVLINTTDNGNVRFNPNLYANGKVCLSILGTWSGQAGESWNPKTSTFLQVLVSIQSLIMVEQPYFNEPSYETQMNTKKGIKASNDYNEEIIPHTIKLAMIDMLKSPPKGFEEVVKTHFKLKKEEILNKTLSWEKNITSNKNIALTNTYRSELITQLNLLE